MSRPKSVPLCSHCHKGSDLAYDRKMIKAGLFKCPSSFKGKVPCSGKKYCVFNYEKFVVNLEGMPINKKDPRSCPEFRHVCPAFRKDYGLTLKDLKIRRDLHCFYVEKKAIIKSTLGAKAKKDAFKNLKKFEKDFRDYPKAEYPHLYACI